MSFPNAPYTLYAVGYTPSNGYGRVFHGAVNSDGYLFLGSGNGVTQYATFVGPGGWNDVNTNSPGTSIASACIMGMTNAGGSTGLIPYLNGTAMTAKNGTTASFTGYSLGNYAGNQQFWNGYIAEIVVFNTVLTTDNRQTLEGYLAWKWGVQATLPSTHPYYSSAP